MIDLVDIGFIYFIRIVMILEDQIDRYRLAKLPNQAGVSENSLLPDHNGKIDGDWAAPSAFGPARM